MKVRARLFLAFLLLVGVAVFALLNTFANELRPALLQSMEDSMVDSANLLAEMARDEFIAGRLSDGKFAADVERFMQRRFDAKIWGISKTGPNHRVYITDANGKVVFDSNHLAIGQDYSRWNDVYRTLRGGYGARASRDKPGDPSSSVMHVAAPILDQGRIIGVLTIAKPSNSIDPFFVRSARNLRQAGLIVIGLGLILGFALSWWLARAFARLADYAHAVSEGRRAQLPQVAGGELGTLAQAIETMRVKLEGKQYVERYVHTLTHEMKSPLAAIRASAELIDDDMPGPERRRFLGNILRESTFLQQTIDQLLDLAVLEHRQGLRDVEAVDLRELAEQVIRDKAPVWAGKSLQIDNRIDAGLIIAGERFLLRQTLSNLLDNAIAFTPASGNIQFTGARTGQQIGIDVTDSGSGVPDYAIHRVFERFYSLPRPDGSRKSSGLGLSFVQEAMALHGGTASLATRPEGGAVARLAFPVKRQER